MEHKSSKGGRPSNYRPDACRVAKTGATQPEIADELGVTNRTLSRWALKYPEFRAALDRGLVRREAERRWAETAPLREAASKILRMIAEARACSGAFEAPSEGTRPEASTLDGALASTIPTNPRQRVSQARRELQSVRYSPFKAEPDPSAGEPIELLDPRSGL